MNITTAALYKRLTKIIENIHETDSRIGTLREVAKRLQSQEEALALILEKYHQHDVYGHPLDRLNDIREICLRFNNE